MEGRKKQFKITLSVNLEDNGSLTLTDADIIMTPESIDSALSGFEVIKDSDGAATKIQQHEHDLTTIPQQLHGDEEDDPTTSPRRLNGMCCKCKKEMKRMIPYRALKN